jgi:putative FmdB family regulatory protein
MPYYNYFCKNCQREFEIQHAYDEKPICPQCKKHSLQKILSVPNVIVKSGKNNTSSTTCPKNNNIPKCSSCQI